MAQEWADSSRNSKERPQTRNSQEDLDGQARRSIASSKGVRGNTSFDLLNESSPLLSPQDPGFQDGQPSPLPSHPSVMLDCGDEEEEESKSVLYLFLLTLSIGG